MEKPIIEVKHVAKRYNIVHQRGNYVALRDILANVIKHPFAFARHKARSAIGLEKKEAFWALKDVSFNIMKGEVIGVIGANGAGKSTLLKILSQITPPTEGEVILRGRVGSLLEVGTGFHPELTGRENIFLNGAILGMKKKEIEKKFDEIVAFAGIDKFLDTPVKHYSSGMHVRLAFSVAAHMEPDILLVDEVLAVGDAEFQKKCLGKMDEITKKEGRTILFVSHNMGAISQLCKKTILLKKGVVADMGETSHIIQKYITEQMTENQALTYPEDSHKKVKIRSVVMEDGAGRPTSNIKLFDPFKVRINYDVNESVLGIQSAVICTDSNDTLVFVSGESDNNPDVLAERSPGNYTSVFEFPGKTSSLNKGTYFLRIVMGPPGFRGFDQVANIPLIVNDTESQFANLDGGKRKGLVLFDAKWGKE